MARHLRHGYIETRADQRFLRQMGLQVKWPQKMRAPDSFWNPNRWSNFHNDHGHKMEDCVTLRNEVNELLKKRHFYGN
ncbi:hypothetical protein F2Q69_00006341 [Brassica cretica]|uniref:Uncharacterized protein n=1 Tax=Brassica cretica TaxID=69181 RepID=A0A8S9P7I2_BRACR|nr:hypothetical protein F2Q69_00006341 [Brassica cretica]